MKVSNKFVVKWYYKDLTTECVIKEGELEVSRGIATRYYKDQPNKNKARMASMRSALILMNRSEREQFWNSYRTLTSEPRW